MNSADIFKAFVISLLSLFITSCSLERKIAQQYVKDKKIRSVLLLFPNSIIKSNLKPEQYNLVGGMERVIMDSASPARSVYNQNIQDSLFWNKYKKGLIEELNSYRFKVYERDNIDEFISLNDSSYVLNLAQVELEEYVYIAYKDEFVYYINDTSAKLYLNAVNLNSWFELDRNNVPDEQYPVLYSSYYMLDKVTDKSRARPVAGIPKYRQDTISMKDVYQLAEMAGKYNAVNFYDYILNLHIQDHLPEGQIPNYYFHYQRKGKLLITNYNPIGTRF